jgi:hypothetical protein
MVVGPPSGPFQGLIGHLALKRLDPVPIRSVLQVVLPPRMSSQHHERPGSPGPATWDGHPRCSPTGDGGDVAREGNEVSAGWPTGHAVGAERWCHPGRRPAA